MSISSRQLLNHYSITPSYVISF